MMKRRDSFLKLALKLVPQLQVWPGCLERFETMNLKVTQRIAGRARLAFLLGLLIGCSALSMGQQWAVAQTSQGTPADATSAENVALPDAVRAAVLQAVATETGLPSNQFRLTQATPKTWSDGCLGLGPPAQMCTAVLVQGWEVRVMRQRQEWVYRTNSSGQTIKLDPAGAQVAQMIAPPAEQIPVSPRPIKFDKRVVFQETKTGGFAGITQVTTLYKDGRLIQTSFGKSRLLHTLSKTEIRAFKKQLEKLHFGQFGGLSYPAPQGAADYFTITLRDGRTTVQYVDINFENAPQDLRLAVQAWHSLGSL